jgi:hypothetical protein
VQGDRDRKARRVAERPGGAREQLELAGAGLRRAECLRLGEVEAQQVTGVRVGRHVPTLLRSYEYTNGVRTADPDWLVELRSYLEQFWSAALHSYKALVEQQPREEPT